MDLFVVCALFAVAFSIGALIYVRVSERRKKHE
jgi:hypothetical protein